MAANLVFDQVCSQVFDKFVRVCDTLSTFFVENLVANRSRFVLVLDKWNVKKTRFKQVQ